MAPLREVSGGMSDQVPIQSDTETLAFDRSALEVGISLIEGICAEFIGFIAADELTTEMYNARTGDSLHPERVLAGMRTEIQMLAGLYAFKVVPLSHAAYKTLLDSCWALDEKGDVVKARFRAKEFNVGKAPGLYAATTSVVAERLLDWYAVHMDWPRIVCDVSSAFVHVPEKDDICMRAHVATSHLHTSRSSAMPLSVGRT